MSWPEDGTDGCTPLAVDTQAHLALERSGLKVITTWQTRRLVELLQWLLDQVPWWRSRLGTQVNLDNWLGLPILSRSELFQLVATHGPARVPAGHGEVIAHYPAGTQPQVAYHYATTFSQRMARHANHADHLRQGRNPYARHAVISDEINPHPGSHLELAASLEAGLGEQWLRKLNQFTRQEHLHWLQQAQPGLLSAPTLWLERLLDEAADRGVALAPIPQLLTLTEAPWPGLRAKARLQLGASIRHRYHHPVCGPLAFQCPAHDDFWHVAVGNVLLEVVDSAGNAPSATEEAMTAPPGRVLVTALHHYATPMVRLDLGDEAALRPLCQGCGLEVPALSQLRQGL